MKIDTTAFGRMGDIRVAVGRLDVRAENESEAAFLRRLYRALVDGEPIQFTDVVSRWEADDEVPPAPAKRRRNAV